MLDRHPLRDHRRPSSGTLAPQPSDAPYEGPSALATVKRQESRFEKVWADLQSKVRLGPRAGRPSR